MSKLGLCGYHLIFLLVVTKILPNGSASSDFLHLIHSEYSWKSPDLLKQFHLRTSVTFTLRSLAICQSTVYSIELNIPWDFVLVIMFI